MKSFVRFDPLKPSSKVQQAVREFPEAAAHVQKAAMRAIGIITPEVLAKAARVLVKSFMVTFGVVVVLGRLWVSWVKWVQLRN